jgi:hypothetical protein
MRECGLEEARSLSDEGKFYETSHSGIKYDSVKERNPDVLGNESRNGFLYSCVYHEKGIKFQNHIKGTIFKAIMAVVNFGPYHFSGDLLVINNAFKESIQKWIKHDAERKQGFMFQIADILTFLIQNPDKIKIIKNSLVFKTLIFTTHLGILQYDENAYVYDDPRLQAISKILKLENAILLEDNELFGKCIDILIFLMKEDIYYRPRFIKILQELYPVLDKVREGDYFNPILTMLEMISWTVLDLQLTPEEIGNIARWN